MSLLQRQDLGRGQGCWNPRSSSGDHPAGARGESQQCSDFTDPGTVDPVRSLTRQERWNTWSVDRSVEKVTDGTGYIFGDAHWKRKRFETGSQVFDWTGSISGTGCKGDLLWQGGAGGGGTDRSNTGANRQGARRRVDPFPGISLRSVARQDQGCM